MDKITLVIDMMEQPKRYSEAQISELLQDEEWKKFTVKHPQAKD